MIEFDYNIAVSIDNCLRNKNIYRNKKVWDLDFCLFSDEEIKNVDKIILRDAYNLNNLNALYNLKSLIIESEDFTNISNNVDLESSSKINNIDDFSIISKLISLEDLKIINDINIDELDISKLQKLKELELINNPKLEKLVGLDRIKTFKNVIIYGTSIVSTFNTQEYIKNTIQTEQNILDINMYPSMIKRDTDGAERLSKLYDDGETNIEFAELIGMFGYVKLSPKLLQEMYERYEILLDIYSLNSDATDKEKIKYVYDFVCSVVKFDYEGINKREKMIAEYIKNYGYIPDFTKKRFSMIHSSYSAFLNGKANCEGIVNLMHFMLSIMHVKSFNVHCIDTNVNYNNLCNHSMLRVLDDDQWLYIDPTLAIVENEVNSKKYYMKNIDELNDLNRYKMNAFEIQKINNLPIKTNGKGK